MLLLFFKQCFSFPFLCLSCRICSTHLVNEDSKIVVKYSSERAQINESFCMNSNKVAFLMHESQKVASNLSVIRTCLKLYSSILKCINYFFPTETN